MLHFDGAPRDWTGTVQDRRAAAELERIEHPLSSTDLAPCDFFLFRCVKRKQDETPDNLISEMRNIIQPIRPDVLKSIFKFWKGILLDYWNFGGRYME
jgi:hypothetical protein